MIEVWKTGFFTCTQVILKKSWNFNHVIIWGEVIPSLADSQLIHIIFNNYKCTLSQKLLVHSVPCIQNNTILPMIHSFSKTSLNLTWISLHWALSVEKEIILPLTNRELFGDFFFLILIFGPLSSWKNCSSHLCLALVAQLYHGVVKFSLKVSANYLKDIQGTSLMWHREHGKETNRSQKTVAFPNHSDRGTNWIKTDLF